MYISGRKVQKPKKRFTLLKLLVLLLLIAGLFAIIYWFLSKQDLSSDSSDGNVRSTNFKEPPKQHITEDYFELDLPQDWNESARKTTPWWVVSWVGKARESDGRTLDVYVDSYPPMTEVNRIVPISAQKDQLAVGSVSSNCTEFYPNYQKIKSGDVTQFEPAKLKWEGVEFICDLSAPFRNVVGTSSSEEMFSVTLNGKTSGGHKYFIVYTDHASHKDDRMFLDILKSFKAR